MIRSIKDKVWVFDVEWVPDPVAGRLVHKLPKDSSDREVLNKMWEAGDATDDNPMPFLKTIVSRVVSLSAVIRHKEGDDIRLDLRSLPSIPVNESEANEKHIIQVFLDAIGKEKPQVVGYNSVSADLKILIQRGIANGIQAKEFSKRPDKPWDPIPDYFSERNDYNVDLMRVVSGWGRFTPSLNEIALVSGIPGKLEVEGQEVALMWLDGRIDDIIAYNEFDALTTYLLWLRVVHFAGLFNGEQYLEEQDKVEQLIIRESEKEERKHLIKFLEEWKRLRNIHSN